MCEYTGELEDSQRHINIQLTDEEVTEAVKKILNESEAVCRQTGLDTFYTQNKPPAVSIVPLLYTWYLLDRATYEYLLLVYKQGDDPF